MNFEIIEIPTNAPIGDEPAGTKSMFWYRDEDTQRMGLFKKLRRDDSGEDWAEKVASEIAKLAGIPAAEYDFGQYEDTRGVISWSIADGEHQVLVHGNEILAFGHDDYPLAPTPSEGRRVHEHSVRRVLAICRRVDGPTGMPVSPALLDGRDAMVGYLLLDAWIGNVDRHHRNWGWVLDRESDRVRLAPSFDHGSSLGHDLREDQREMRLHGPDPKHSVEAFWRRGKSRFWTELPTAGWQSPQDAFAAAATVRPRAAAHWLEALRSVEMSDVASILGRIPAARMSPLTSEFCLTMLKETREALLASSSEKR